MGSSSAPCSARANRRAALSTPARPSCGLLAFAPALARASSWRRVRTDVLALLLAAAASGWAASAAAQVSGSVSVMSEYIVRGYSVSAGKPAASLNLSYDDPSGLYLNGSLIGALDTQNKPAL